MAAPTRGLVTHRSRLGLAGVRRAARSRRAALAGPGGRAQRAALIAALLVTALLLDSCAAAPVVPPASSASPAAGPATFVPSALASGAPLPIPTATPVALVEAPTDGVLETAAEAARPVVAVMVDDAPAARPQSGLAAADILIQAPAEGGIPRYMALYQTASAPAVGPIRSSRLYFVGWAAQWHALYAHVGGAPNALVALQQLNGSLVWNADEYVWASYMPRIATRVPPHNVYSSTTQLEALAKRLAVPAAPAPSWSFVDPAPPARRPATGALQVPYPAGVITYEYDPATDRYLRSVDGVAQVDPVTGARVAPFDVVVIYVSVGPLVNQPGQPTNQLKGRLELGYTGSGQALVLRDGVAVDATWSKASDGAPLLLTQASGAGAGTPVLLVRGQVVIQVVPEGTVVTVASATAPRGPRAPTPR
jgi:Protein of unknown function (DUF3048) N-terminal domain/Protein of unknown function (DUF3048) C-terminal domain